MLDRSRALQILGLGSGTGERGADRGGADENEAAVAYRELRRHVQARERAATDDAARELRRQELRDLERAWMAFSSLPLPTAVIQPTDPPRAFRLAPRWILAWAVVATLVAVGLAGYLAVGNRSFGPLVLVDAAGGGGGEGGDGGFAIDGAGEEGASEGEGNTNDALDAGPRAELVVESDVEGSMLSVRTRGESPEVVAEGAADGTSYWLAPGDYSVEVRHPDCRGSWQQDVTVAGGQKRQLTPELCGDTGWMVVRSNVAGDELSIDGRKVGGTGEQKHRVTPGEHEVRVAKNGYQSWEGIVEVEPGQVLGIRPRLEAVQPAARKPRPKKPQEADGAQPQTASGEAGADPSAREDQYGRWHEDARRWLLARYDFDRSGSLDSREEIEAVPCEHWLGLEQSYDQSNLGLSLTRFYGFDGDGWRSGALGVADTTRDLAYERMQACGLR